MSTTTLIRMQIADAIKASNLTLAEMAKLTGVSARTLHSISAGKGNPTIESLRLVEQYIVDGAVRAPDEQAA